MIRRLATLVGGSITCWVIAAIPARLLGGDTLAVYMAVALMLCLVPAALTLLGAGWAFRNSPDQQALVALGGGGVRMFLVLGAAWFLHATVPFFQERPGFWASLLGFYLVTLALEVVAVVQLLREAGQTVHAPPRREQVSV